MAIEMPEIDYEKCDGCGLCVEVCRWCIGSCQRRSDNYRIEALRLVPSVRNHLSPGCHILPVRDSCREALTPGFILYCVFGILQIALMLLLRYG